jgi:type VII secretion protein EccE
MFGLEGDPGMAQPAPKLRTRRVLRHAGAPGVVQLVCLEVAVVIVLGTAFVSIPLLIAGGAGALLLLAIAFGRADQRWWYEQAAAHWQLRRRRRSNGRLTSRLPGADARGLALATLADGHIVRNVSDRGRSIGVGSDERGWFVAVGVGTWLDASGERALRLELDQVVRVLDESSVPVTTLQLVSYLTQAPSGLVDGAGAAARSYQELAGGCPIDQAVWLVARLSPADAVEAAASRGGGITGVDRALSAIVGRMEKALAAAGLSYQVLEADALAQALTLSCGLDRLTAADGAARERWASWRAGGLDHVGYTITRWPGEPAERLVTELSAGAGCAVGVSILMRPKGGEVAFVGLVRVVAPTARLRTATKQLTRTGRRLGLRLRRLDGEHALAVYATAPTGGGL